MVSLFLTYSLLGLTFLSLGLFACAEIWPAYRTHLAALAAVFEGGVFLVLAAVFESVVWGGIPSWVMACLPLFGAGFAFRMAWRRWVGLPA